MELESLNRLSGNVIEAAIAVHRELGPGLLESTYEACLFFELNERGIPARRQVNMPVIYRGNAIDVGYRLDVLVADILILELKAVDKIIPIHEAQLLSYLKLSGKPLGLLLNFNVELLKHGIKRIAN